MKNTSKKGFTLVEIMIVVVIIGLLAAMAVPAFNKVRENAREKTVTENLRQVASNAQQYLLETGESQVSYSSLVPTYFANIQTVADENYGALVIEEDSGSISVSLSGEYVIYSF